MRDSTQAKAVMYAYNRGYRARKDGTVSGIRTDSVALRKDTQGYVRFQVNPPWRHNSLGVCVHQLIALQKFGEKALDKDVQTRHLNGNPGDNSWDNIAIGTMSDNMMDRPEEKRKRMARRAGRSQSPLTIEDVQRIRYLREEEGWKYSEIMREYPISKSTLSNICNYKTWRDI
jgi:hypothetical protein